MHTRRIDAPTAIDRNALAIRFNRLRDRSRRLFDLLTPDAYYARPDRPAASDRVLRRAPAAFSFNTLVKTRARAARASTRGCERAVRARHRPGRGRRRGAPRAPARDGRRATEVRRSRTRPTAGARRARSRRRSTSPGIRCSTARRRCTPSSNTRRCTRRRCCTCGTACRSSRSGAGRIRGPASTARRPPRGTDRRARRAAPRSASTQARSRSAGTTSVPACAVEVPAFAIDAHDVTNADFLEFVEAGGYEDARWWTRRRLGVGAARSASTHPLFWERRRRRAGAGAACSTRLPLPLGVAGLREPRRGHARTRAGAARGCRPRPSFSARPTAHPAGASARIPGATAPPDATRGDFDFARWDPEPAGRHPAGRSAWGVRRSGRQRLGVDRRRRSRRSPASRRCRRTRSTPPTSSTASTS